MYEFHLQKQKVCIFFHGRNVHWPKCPWPKSPWLKCPGRNVRGRNVCGRNCRAPLFQSTTGQPSYEPRCEKTGLRRFRPSPTQTRLCSHTRWLESGNVVFRKKRDCTCTIFIAKTKALISFAVTVKLICVFVFAFAKKTIFS